MLTTARHKTHADIWYAPLPSSNPTQVYPRHIHRKLPLPDPQGQQIHSREDSSGNYTRASRFHLRQCSTIIARRTRHCQPRSLTDRLQSAVERTYTTWASTVFFFIDGLSHIMCDPKYFSTDVKPIHAHGLTLSATSSPTSPAASRSRTAAPLSL